MKLVILALILVILVTADNTITIDCHQCGPVACLVLTGGGFKGKDMPVNAGSCEQAGITKATAKFECGKGDCSEGCLLTETVGTQSMSVCTNTPTGKQEVDGFNLLYSLQEGDETGSKTYDWCGCSSVIRLECRTKGNFSYIYTTGGGFKGLDIRHNATCQQMEITAPVEIRLVCNKSICISGCFVTEIMGPDILRVCSYSEEGAEIIDFLNQLYQKQQNDPSKTYDWCGCEWKGKQPQPSNLRRVFSTMLNLKNLGRGIFDALSSQQ